MQYFESDSSFATALGFPRFEIISASFQRLPEMINVGKLGLIFRVLNDVLNIGMSAKLAIDPVTTLQILSLMKALKKLEQVSIIKHMDPHQMIDKIVILR